MIKLSAKTKFQLVIIAAFSLAILGQDYTARAQEPARIDLAAPELVGGPWINSDKNGPVKLAARKGKVTIVQFWTFG